MHCLYYHSDSGYYLEYNIDFLLIEKCLTEQKKWKIQKKKTTKFREEFSPLESQKPQKFMFEKRWKKETGRNCRKEGTSMDFLAGEGGGWEKIITRRKDWQSNWGSKS